MPTRELKELRLTPEQYSILNAAFDELKRAEQAARNHANEKYPEPTGAGAGAGGGAGSALLKEQKQKYIHLKMMEAQEIFIKALRGIGIDDVLIKELLSGSIQIREATPVEFASVKSAGADSVRGDEPSAGASDGVGAAAAAAGVAEASHAMPAARRSEEASKTSTTISARSDVMAASGKTSGGLGSKKAHELNEVTTQSVTPKQWKIVIAALEQLFHVYQAVRNKANKKHAKPTDSDAGKGLAKGKKQKYVDQQMIKLLQEFINTLLRTGILAPHARRSSAGKGEMSAVRSASVSKNKGSTSVSRNVASAPTKKNSDSKRMSNASKRAGKKRGEKSGVREATARRAGAVNRPKHTRSATKTSVKGRARSMSSFMKMARRDPSEALKKKEGQDALKKMEEFFMTHKAGTHSEAHLGKQYAGIKDTVQNGVIWIDRNTGAQRRVDVEERKNRLNEVEGYHVRPML